MILRGNAVSVKGETGGETTGLAFVPVRRRADGWALVEVRFDGPRALFTMDDEWLERSRLHAFVGWLRDVAGGRTPDELSLRSSTEPKLSFTCLANDDRARIGIVYELDSATRGPSERTATDALWLGLDMPREDVASAAETLAAEVASLEANGEAT